MRVTDRLMGHARATCGGRWWVGPPRLLAACGAALGPARRAKVVTRSSGALALKLAHHTYGAEDRLRPRLPAEHVGAWAGILDERRHHFDLERSGPGDGNPSIVYVHRVEEG